MPAYLPDSPNTDLSTDSDKSSGSALSNQLLTANPPALPPPIDSPPATANPPVLRPPNNSPLQNDTPRNQGESPVNLGEPDDARVPLHPHSESENGRRRSNRPAVPSTRLELRQQIGTNVIRPSVSNKVTEDDNDSPPDWFNNAVSDLLKDDLGKDWSDLVQKWTKLESLLGFGKSAKGPLPVKLRPEEWVQWTHKGKQGLRFHDKPPFVADPLEFGIAIRKWWVSIQPAFRGPSDGPMPLPVYSTAASTIQSWSEVRKSGPNGLLSLLMLLLWWGRAASAYVSQWEEDSRGSWAAVVQDLSQCFDEFLKLSPPVNTSKRCQSENIAPSRNAKWYV
ncbi:hypothetical protein DFP72DRAFT_1077736 [Ephemerocybe angulata]|uniref:Uncharacterized protein n=1 Tax=Ephemerocybe angulata TaxID=980116 RepID=A0A8H6HFD2_9AGAR|nr:hypothetical protein DFP72DRAFT_1077736 [Tulosesus angulatus]